MMFKTQSLAVLLACITSANAFSTISVGRSTFVQRSSIVASPSKTSTVVFSSEISEDAAPAETDTVAEVEATPEVEVAEVEAAAPAEAEEEEKTKAKP